MSTDNADIFNEYFTQAFNSVKTVKSTMSSQFHLTDKRNHGTVIGRPIVDEKGRPFRVINNLVEITVVDPNTKELWRIKLMDPSNYIRMGAALSEDQVKLCNSIREKAKKLSDEDEELGKKFGERFVYRETKKYIMMFMKINKCTPSNISDKYQAPSTDSVTLVTTSSQAFLEEFENRWKIKCEVGGTNWLKTTFGRDLGKTDRFMMIQTRKKLPTEGIGFKVTMEFTEGNPIELTEEDLKASKDLNEQLVGTTLDMDKLYKINSMLDEEISIRKKVISGMSSEEPAKPVEEISGGSMVDIPAPTAKDDFDF